MVFCALKAQLAGGLLLQRRRGEGRRRVAPTLLAVHTQHGERSLGRVLERALHGARFGLGGEAELFDLGARVLDQLARKLLLRMFQLGVDGPVFPRDEGGDFVLALANHAQCRALHTARR